MKFLSYLFPLLVAAVAAYPRVSFSDVNGNSEYVNNLVSMASPTANSQLHRSLNQNQDQPNIAGYSLKFEQCQFVKTYDDSLADNEQSDTVLAVKRFAVFRLCPDSNCTSCSTNFGEYIVDLDQYLSYTTSFYQKYEEAMCNACDATCSSDAYQAADDADAAAAADDGARRLKKDDYYFTGEVDCSVCVRECENMAQVEANGFVDAVKFITCTMVYNSEDGSSLYAGPFCASSGSKINIGIFTDAYCTILDSSKKVDDYIMVNGYQASLSHAALKKTYTNTCISCLEPQQEQNNNHGNDAEDNDKVIETCEQLYNSAAKCEKSNGFDDGMSNYYSYDNQLENEAVVCDYITSIKSGTYNEQGEIISGSYARSVSGSTTGGQKFALTVFILGTAGLAMYAAVLHAKLTRNSKFAPTGGALA
jgi:hypothetical protein